MGPTTSFVFYRSHFLSPTSTTINTSGYYVLSEGCTCPCVCPSQLSTQNVFVSTSDTGKSKVGKKRRNLQSKSENACIFNNIACSVCNLQSVCTTSRNNGKSK